MGHLTFGNFRVERTMATPTLLTFDQLEQYVKDFTLQDVLKKDMNTICRDLAERYKLYTADVKSQSTHIVEWIARLNQQAAPGPSLAELIGATSDEPLSKKQRVEPEPTTTTTQTTWSIDDTHRVELKEWKGKTYVDIRRLYKDQPTTKGIMLSLDAWNKLKNLIKNGNLNF